MRRAQERVFKSKSQIVALVDVEGVKKHSARLLYRANICTVEDINSASEDAIREILMKGAAAALPPSPRHPIGRRLGVSPTR